MKFIYTFATRGMATLFAFFFSILIARLLPQEDAGAFFTGLTVMMGLALIIRMGFDNYIIRRNAVDPRSKISSLLMFTVISFSIYIILMLFIMLTSSMNESISQIIFDHDYMIYFILSSLFFALLWLASGFLKSIGRAPSANFIEAGLLPATLIIIYMAVDDILTLQKAAQFYLLVSAVLSIGVYTYLIGKYSSKQKIEFTFSLAEIKESYSIMFAALMDYFVVWFSALVLTFYISMADVAEFHAALRLSALISFILIVVNSISAPVFAKLFHDDQLEEVGKALRISTSLMTLVSLFPLVLFCFFPEFLLGFFGEAYRSASTELIILSIGQLINVISGSVGYILMMSGHSHVYKVNTFYGTLASIIFTLLLIPLFGTIGAAIATSVAISVKNLLGVYQVYKIHGIISLPNPVYMKRILTLKEKYEIFTHRN